MAAVKRLGNALEWVSNELNADKDVVMVAMKSCGSALEHDSEGFLFICTKLIMKNDAYALKYASNELKADKEVVMMTVKGDGYALKYASNEPKADKKVVMVAVKSRWLSLKCECLDKELVAKWAKENDACVLKFASSELKSDRGHHSGRKK